VHVHLIDDLGGDLL